MLNLTMSQPAISPAHEAFIRQWLPLVLGTIAVAPGEDVAQARQSTLVLIDFLRPRNPTEVMITGLCIATLFGGMEALRQSQDAGLTPQLACRLRNSAFSAFRMVMAMTRKLQQDRGEPQNAFLPDLPELTALLPSAPARPQPPAPQSAPAPRPAANPPVPRPAAPTPAKAPPPAQAVPLPPGGAPQIAPRQFNPMPSEKSPAASLAALLSATPPGQPPAPMTRKQRKAAKYALSRALREAAKVAAPAAT